MSEVTPEYEVPQMLRHLHLVAKNVREAGDAEQVMLTEDGVTQIYSLADELDLIAINLHNALNLLTPEEEAERSAAAEQEVRLRLREFMRERGYLRSMGLEPRGVVLPARLNVPYTGPDSDSNFKATLMGLPIAWADDERWGLTVGLGG